jgi:N-acetylglucosaminyldiphosphoundecaprenol N-acetyl-beta-D-mannosaminyltransferase
VVVTSNIHHLRLARDDAQFEDVVKRAELNVADGWPLVAGTRLFSAIRVPERIAGIDLVDRLLGQEAVPLRLAILGGPPGAAEALAWRIAPMHEVAYVNPLPKDRWDTDDNLATLRADVLSARPTLTLVGIGAPRQEILADSLRDVITGPAIGCGAALEVLAGLRPRAPRILRAAGLEWAFRLALEPRRLLPRYVVAAQAFAGAVARELLRRRPPD